MSRSLTSLAAAALVLGGLAGTAQAEALTLRVTATPAVFKPMFEELVQKFEAKNPDIKIALTVPPGEQEKMVQDILRRAVVNDLPDVTFQGYDYIRLLADRNLPVPLDKFIANDPDWKPSTYSASVANSATVNGAVRGLGVGMSFPVLYYNVDLVKKAQGGSAAFPDTWGGVVALAEKISQVQPDVIGAFHRFHSWMFQAQVESRGGRLMSPDEKKVAFDSPEGRATFDLYHRLAKAGQARAAMTREQAREAFLGGTVGILTDSSSSISRHLKQTTGKFELGVAHFPIVKGKGRIPAAGIASMMLTHDAARQKAAWRFMTFVSGLDGQVVVGTKTSYVPANAVAAERPDLLGDYYAKNPIMKGVLETVPVASSWYAFPGENAIKIDKVIYDKVQAVLTLREKPEEALVNLKREIEALLPK